MAISTSRLSFSSKVFTTPKKPAITPPVVKATVESPNRPESAPGFSTPEPLFQPIQPATPLIRNRRPITAASRLEEKTSKLIDEKAQQMGVIHHQAQRRSDKAVGAGILVSPTHFLTAKHCVVAGGIYRVTLPGGTYKVKQVLSADDADNQQNGLLCGPKGDMVLLELEVPPGITPPGIQFGYTPIKVPTALRPTVLYHLGFQAANSDLKVSSSETRPKSLITALEKQYDIVGSRVSRSDRDTWFRVEAVSYEGEHPEVVLKSASGRQVTLTLKNGGLYDKKGVLCNPENPFLLELGYLIGVDHIVVAHKTGKGSSGGVYLTEDGELYAVHCGQVEESLLSSVPSKHFANHVAVFPWTLYQTTFIWPYLDFEGRLSVKLSDSDFLFHQKYLDATLSVNGVSVGKITEIDYSESGEVTFKVVNTDGEDVLVVVPVEGDVRVGITNVKRSEVVLNLLQSSLKETEYTITESQIKKLESATASTGPSATNIIQGISSPAKGNFADSEKAVIRRFEEFINQKKSTLDDFRGGTHHVLLNEEKENNLPVVKAHLWNGNNVKLYLDPEKGGKSERRAVYAWDSERRALKFQSITSHRRDSGA